MHFPEHLFQAGNSFGEISLLDNTTRNAGKVNLKVSHCQWLIMSLDVIASTDLVVYVLNKKMFISLIGSIEKAKGKKLASNLNSHQWWLINGDSLLTEYDNYDNCYL